MTQRPASSRRQAEDHPPSVPQPLERLTDVEAYRVLVTLAERTRALSARCWSTVAATALAAAAIVLRKLASALYRANIND